MVSTTPRRARSARTRTVHPTCPRVCPSNRVSCRRFCRGGFGGSWVSRWFVSCSRKSGWHPVTSWACLAASSTATHRLSLFSRTLSSGPGGSSAGEVSAARSAVHTDACVHTARTTSPNWLHQAPAPSAASPTTSPAMRTSGTRSSAATRAARIPKQASPRQANPKQASPTNCRPTPTRPTIPRRASVSSHHSKPHTPRQERPTPPGSTCTSHARSRAPTKTTTSKSKMPC